jgi:hypothetical protein
MAPLLREFLRYCESVGADGASLAAAIGLDRAAARRSQTAGIPARKARDPVAGGEAGHGRSRSGVACRGAEQSAMFGLVGHLALISRNVGEALGHLQRYQRFARGGFVLDRAAHARAR